MRKKILLSSLICFLFLSACADSDSDQKTDSDQKSEAKPATVKIPVPICPQVAVVRALQNISDYGAEEPSPSQLVSQAHMRSIEGDCAYIRDEKDSSKDGIDIRFTLNFIAARGPRLGGLHVSVPYFIAIVDPDDNVVEKSKMTKEFGFSSSEKTAEDSDDLHVFIPLAKDKQTAGPNYRVFIGFQLNKEQLNAIREEGADTSSKDAAH